MKSQSICKKEVFLLGFILLVSIVVLINIGGSKLHLFPDSSILVEPYDDSLDYYSRGNSRTEKFTINDNAILFSFILKEGTLYPYAGLVLKKRTTRYLFDGFSFFSKDDFIRIRIKADTSRTVRFHILTEIEGFSESGKPLSCLYLYHEIPVWKNKDYYQLHLKDFAVPEWWFEIHKFKVNDPKFKPDFRRTAFIQIEREQSLPLDTTETYYIESITLEHSLKIPILTGILVFAILTAIVLLPAANFHLFIRQKPQNGKVLIYKPVQMANKEDITINRIISCLNENYHEPEFTAERASALCNVSQEKIGKTLKKICKLSFSAYLNMIRINEAKKLLCTTDMSITDIAMRIGYNNISYFNNVFKRLVKMSPGRFRVFTGNSDESSRQ